ncbi:LysR substrate-binding domain-containing protein [Hydrogenophaga sp. BPS33]|uniref:LysR substrate-binding domain-containing protein n=1 Tax=Hydrogenophaga sp. BPS33 TaxID=2651974 RepID=UPI00135BF01C|nr:LysR substrate-binding domain-containing protein [Hydrogenophaga sp. BPS33]
MKLSDIENFEAIAQTGSIRAAAKLRGLTSPALTQCVARLENELHVALVVRTTRGAVLTEYGIAFLRRAQLITSEVRRASEEIGQMLSSQGGSVSIGTSATPATMLLPDVLAQFRRDRPGVQVQLSEGLFHAHLSRLREGKMDIAVGPVPAVGLDSDVLVEPLFENDLIIACGLQNPLRVATSLADLQEAEWIGTGPFEQGPGAAIADAFREHGLPVPRMMVRSESMAAIYTLLMRTDLICALPRATIQGEPLCRALCAIPVVEILPHYTISLFRLADSPLLPAARHLATLLHRHAHYVTQAMSKKQKQKLLNSADSELG